MKIYHIIFLCIFNSCFFIPYKVFSFEYFDKSIDYWNLKELEKTSNPIHNKLQPRTQSQSPKVFQENEKFDWKPYLNPQTTDDLREVFREGNHTPPTPLLEVAKNPTDENIKNWFELVKRKISLLPG